MNQKLFIQYKRKEFSCPTDFANYLRANIPRRVGKHSFKTILKDIDTGEYSSE